MTIRVGTKFFVFLIRESKPNETIFFGVFDKNRQQNQAKETKQNKNKVKRKVEEDSPCEDVLSIPGNGARKRLDECSSTSLGDPKKKVR